MTNMKLSDYLKNFLETDEGRASINNFFNKIEQEHNILSSQLDRFHNYCGFDTYSSYFDTFVNKVIEKYNSSAYKDRWYSRRIEPPQELFWFLFRYAEKYGRSCDEKEWDEHGGVFVTDMFFVHGYYFSRLDGQGSIIRISRIE